LYKKICEGYDLVLAKRIERTHSAFRQLTAKLYFKLLSKLTEESVDGSYGSFSILSRKVIDSFLLFGERERHYLFILRWLGFRIGSIDYLHQERHSGKSSYTIRRLFRHALAGLLFQSTVILRWIISIGFLSAIIGVVLAFYLVFRLIYYVALPGWTSLIVLILISTGAILVSQGMIGLYVGRIFEQTKQRPLYVVDVVSERALQW
jgi:dolichol-phosphate mannosyltransferase